MVIVHPLGFSTSGGARETREECRVQGLEAVLVTFSYFYKHWGDVRERRKLILAHTFGGSQSKIG